MPDFTLRPETGPVDAGIDVSQGFVVDGIQYNALPGFEPGFFNGSAPDMDACKLE